MQKVIKSYEIVGDIALVEIPHGYGREEVASAIMKEHKRVRVVAEKKGRRGVQGRGGGIHHRQALHHGPQGMWMQDAFGHCHLLFF